MDENKMRDLLAARRHTRRAGQWLAVMQFRVRPGAPAFSPRISTYGQMVGRRETDEVRLAACQQMLLPVEIRAQQERWKYEGEHGAADDRDPFGAEWRTTERGAVLEAVAGLLRSAIDTFEKHAAETE